MNKNKWKGKLDKTPDFSLTVEVDKKFNIWVAIKSFVTVFILFLVALSVIVPIIWALWGIFYGN